MTGFSPDDLVRVWERGVGQHPVHRALTILAFSTPELEPDALWALPIGDRDDRLLALRQQTFGPTIEGTTRCSVCGERLELTFAAAALRTRRDDSAPEPPLAGVRPLTSRDLAAAARCASLADAERLLAERCTGAGAAVVDLAEASRLLAAADTGAVCSVDVQCSLCGAQWECDFDVAGFLWAEIEAAALRLLRDVHLLARAYGWHERDILAMSPLRRAAYLELVQ